MPEPNEIRGICANCARFPGRFNLYGVPKTDDTCPVPKNKEKDKFLASDFQDKMECPKFEDGMASLPETEQFTDPYCFFPEARDKKCYPGCALYNKDDKICYVLGALDSFINKTELEATILENTIERISAAEKQPPTEEQPPAEEKPPEKTDGKDKKVKED